MKKVLGIDLGSTTGKAVVLDGEKLIGSAIIRARRTPRETTDAVIAAMIEQESIASMEEVGSIVSTGYGRAEIGDVDKNISEITCHARGASWLHPKTRTIVDIGGQDCKVISLGPEGRVLDFVMNEKCAAGTGRFFESMTRALDCGLADISKWSLLSSSPVQISSQCSVFAETEVVSLLNSGTDIHDIAAGINSSIAVRIQALLRKVGCSSDVVMTGGCAQSLGLIERLEQKIGAPVVRLEENPQLAGAIGAALFARDIAER